MKRRKEAKSAIAINAGPGIALEKTVARVQQMLDHDSTVTHNEVLTDRIGNRRQCDVVIRGQFGGRPILGIVECKDHSRRKGPDAVEAFSKKAENLGANLKIMVSTRGFTEQALRLAKSEGIACLSPLPSDPEKVGFSIGDTWYGVIKQWKVMRLTLHFAMPTAPISDFDIGSVKFDGKAVINWFVRELFTKYKDESSEGEHTLTVNFDQPQSIQIGDSTWPVAAISCVADRVLRKKKKWVSWSGDALLDWHTGTFQIPPGGVIVGSTIESDISTWSDYDGEIPTLGEQSGGGFLTAILYNVSKWDERKNGEVPDLGSLGD